MSIVLVLGFVLVVLVLVLGCAVMKRRAKTFTLLLLEGKALHFLLLMPLLRLRLGACSIRLEQ